MIYIMPPLSKGGVFLTFGQKNGGILLGVSLGYVKAFRRSEKIFMHPLDKYIGRRYIYIVNRYNG